MSPDVLYPILIAAGCAAVVVIVHLLTRQKPTRHDFTMPDQTRRRRARRRPKAQIVQRSPLPVEAAATSEALLSWHIRNEPSITVLIRAGDDLALGNTPGSGPTIEGTERTLDDAVASHPAPEMRAELAAFRAATNAMRDALERDDQDAHERHRYVYLGYRKAWLERLWQFPVNQHELAYLRNRALDS